MSDFDESAHSAVHKDFHGEIKHTQQRSKSHRDKLWRWSLEDDACLLDMTEDRRPWSEIEKCFPGRTESALRQRQSTL
ncbi:hypothetical protein EMCG_01880 [[Emmonsia] crescens]|uniref:Myb-like domain-containing protein n=1 Tax=[Emmonsia] crescens TaxID=73230 RepID=A0A0G2J9D2_9EURO|nr:hypothetical protein EMCG_01880 [Emmonsia crescens UAMH 3008]